MIYPSITEYIRSFRHPEDYFEDSKLQSLRPLPSPHNPSDPHFMTGRFGLIVRLENPESKQIYAAKAFLNYNAQREKRLAEIAKLLKELQSPYFIDFEYYADELWVSSELADDGEFPMLLMPWVQGETIGEYVYTKAKARDKQALSDLYDAFVELSDFLLSSDFAHGDLKHDNIIVGAGSQLTLIDYDGMYLPSLADAPSGELGGAAFQHPARKNHAYNGDIDDFPILVFLLSLKALSHSPELIDLVPKDDHLLLQSEDYKNVMDSPVIQAIWRIDNPQLQELFGLMISSLGQKHIKVIGLPVFVGRALQPSKQEFVALRQENRLLKAGIALQPTPTDFIETVNGVSFKMIYVEGGSFMMGYDPDRDGEYGNNDEKPLHQVTLEPFYVAETQVTQALWEAVMGENPSYFNGAKRPVEQVSWDDCQAFIQKLEELTGRKFRLPSEAQWEYAARGGLKSKGYQYAGSDDIDEVAWYNVNAYDVGKESADYGTHPVGQKQANELGIYDMSGNVWEWCEDDWHDSYEDAPTDGSAWVDNPRAKYRLLRGGSWIYNPDYCRVAYRFHYYPDSRINYFGCRLFALPVV
ncbi:MAG: SUMF1/EgtB/PvdO family nonheme iron enzyme [Bernardetiaceae bacterium]|nr:SUMF1/EgtB/PvdO family nonheme iron enzyme [Bernardetiaceae bacterium]